MSKFANIVNTKTLEQQVLQGNHCFALGAIHAGYHAADGYPGTPSTEVIEALLEVPEHIHAGWSVNEAVSVGVATGHAIAGRDVLVTMKVPGLFQAGDVIASSAFTKTITGALVFYIATDHVPSSTQYIVDSRELLASYKLPIIEPRDHQELYNSAVIAADMSRQFNTPVVVLVSAILAHSRGLISPQKFRTIEPALPFDGVDGVALPAFARRSYDQANNERIPSIAQWSEEEPFTKTSKGREPWGVICTGEAALIVRETLHAIDLRPSVLELSLTNPLSTKTISQFIASLSGECYIIEDGERFVEKQLTFLEHKVIGKENHLNMTNWTPDTLQSYFAFYNRCEPLESPKLPALSAVTRPASICPGCPYRPISLVLAKLKKQQKLELIFGDIGCSTLLCNLNAFDLNFSMGASESLRQGYVLSKPESAGRVVSIIGDSSECHSGMDATRNAIFRKVGGVKIILDNAAVAMTGGQISPTSAGNNSFNFVESLTGEGARAIELDSYNYFEIEQAVIKALSLAEEGVMSTLILKAPCLNAVKKVDRKKKALRVHQESCIDCGNCLICTGIERVTDSKPQITENCNRCGVGDELCVSRCPVNAIIESEEEPRFTPQKAMYQKLYAQTPDALHSKQRDIQRIAIRGVGGQGTLFMSKVLSEVAKRSPQSGNIIAGEVHGMAQKGGAVCSTFAYGDVASPIFRNGSVDVLVAMEIGEVFRPDFLSLLKPGGTLILNDYHLLPHGLSEDKYPSRDAILAQLTEYQVIVLQDCSQAINTVMLGVIASLGLFNQKEMQLWKETLEELSPNERIAQVNLSAFLKGTRALQSGTAIFVDHKKSAKKATATRILEV